MESDKTEKLSHEVLFRVDNEMFDSLPSGRNRSAFCRKAIEVFQKILGSPKQKGILELLEYDSFNIFERVVITQKTPVNSEVSIKEIEELKQTIIEFKMVLIIFGDLFGLFNKTLREKPIDVETFKGLAPPKDKMELLQKVMKIVRTQGGK